MPPPRKTLDEKLSDLDAMSSEQDRSIQAAAIKEALRDRHQLVVAKAARLCADALLYELVPDLSIAYARFLDKPTKTDPNCLAKKAIVRALVSLDYDDSSFFLAGLRYRQQEPVWGGSQDTAVDVRCSCAMGLVGTGYPRALVELAELLHDAEADARAGAARAIACGDPRQAELLLRPKVLAGDTEPLVIGECFAGLLAVEPDESLPFVARHLSDRDEVLRELAALALGESHLEAAVDHLRAAWEDVFPPAGFRRVLLRAAAVNRSDAAIDWLIGLIEQASADVVDQVLEVLAIYERNARLKKRIEAALAKREN